VEEETIDFNALAQQLSADFEDFSEHRNIELKVVSEGALKFNMNKDLAVILLTNLIKNAMVHGTEGKSVDIDIFSNCIHFTNFGGEKELNAREIFKRFSKSTPSQKSTGLGLAIAKAIANMYSIQLTYHFSDRHTFELQFPSD